MTLDQAGWNREEIAVSPAPLMLADFVDFVWIDERAHRSRLSHRWRVVADDAPHVIYTRFATETGLHHRLHIVGARTRYEDVDCSRRLMTVGARLRPGALPALFDVPAHELTNHSVPAELLVRNPAREVMARLESAPAEDVVAHVASFIAELVVAGRTLDVRARRLGAIPGTAASTVRDVAHTLGVGERALRAWSVAHLGLGLRRFLRIRRLHAALEHRLRNPNDPWSRIAATAGFADQPHLVRDCRALLGESPREFFARAG